jgi:hypothetical protein
LPLAAGPLVILLGHSRSVPDAYSENPLRANLSEMLS